MSVLLEAKAVHAGYGSVTVVRDLDLHVDAGEVVALLGPNGAGKTTTLLTLSGVLAPLGGEVRWKGEVTREPLYKRARRGLGLVTEDRALFRQLTTLENLRIGDVDPQRAIEMFPELKTRLKVKVGLLSGGEQQMLSLVRALKREPELLLIDELSLGLAPLVVDRLMEIVRQAADRGVGVLVVEQHVHKILGIADRVYVLDRGKIGLSGAASELRGRLEEIERSYLAPA